VSNIAVEHLEDEQENVVETVCKDCVFATYEDPEDINLQTGCQANMLQRFEDTGVTLNEYIDEDQNQKFFGIPGRVCLYNRPQSWKDLLEAKQNTDLIGVARDEMTLRMEVIVYIGEEDDFTTIGMTLDSLAHNKLKPSKVVLCDHQNIRPSALRTWLAGRVPLAWRAEHIREGDADFMRVVDIGAKKTTSEFFAIFRAGEVVPKDFISSLDKALHDDLERFLLLKPYDDKGNGMVIQNVIHKQIGGNRDKPLVEKLENVTRSQECQHLIKEVTSLVPSLNCQSSV